MIDLSIHKALLSSHGQMSFDVALRLEKGTFTAVQGKSGAGKTSLLRMIAGLMKPDSGSIQIDGETWFSSNTKADLNIQKRNVGFVFQDYALFPNMTVLENLQFAQNKKADSSIIPSLVEVMELGDLQKAKPDLLSGGQKQRVALARALVQKPKLLLLDEPLSALDIEIRQKLQAYILAVHKEYGLTTLMVTHDVAETLKMADYMLVMEEGKLIQQGKPADVLTNRSVSGKFQFTGEIMAIAPEDVVSIISVLVGKDLVKVISELNESQSFSIGDKVLVASKAFNPILKKL